MTCLYPKFLGGWNRPTLISCGRCIVCRENRIKDWYFRLTAELGYCDYSYTLTLTYDDEFLPMTGDLCISDVQKFFKRLRKDAGKDIEYRYYYAGEYGERGGRPHYHVLLFCYTKLEEPKIKERVEKCWTVPAGKNSKRIGHIHYDSMTKKSIRYTLDYLQKDYFRHMASKNVAPFQRMSKGLGLSYLLDSEKRISDLGYVTIGKTKFRVPKYYRKKSALVNESLNEKMSEYMSDGLNDTELEERYRDKCRGITSKALQVERNIKQRKRLKRGGL